MAETPSCAENRDATSGDGMSGNATSGDAASGDGIQDLAVIGRTTGRERSDVSPRLVAWLAGGLAAFLVLTPFALLLVYPESASRRARTELPPLPAPRLQTNPAGDLRAFRQSEDARLSSFGWVDRDKGIVRMPIERAMGSIAERGMPGWPQP